MFISPLSESWSSCSLGSWVGANSPRMWIMLESRIRYCKESSPAQIPPDTSVRALCCRCKANSLPSPTKIREDILLYHARWKLFYLRSWRGGGLGKIKIILGEVRKKIYMGVGDSFQMEYKIIVQRKTDSSYSLPYWVQHYNLKCHINYLWRIPLQFSLLHCSQCP